MRKKLSRRELLRLLALVAGKAGIGALTGCKPLAGRAADDLEPRAYLPLVMGGESSAVIPTPTNTPIATLTKTPTPTATLTKTSTATATPAVTPTSSSVGSRVVHVRDIGVTSWNYGNTYYGNYVNQARVDTMVERGVKALTNASSLAQAWQTLVPGYAPGKGIAIKVNFNNNYQTCNSTNLELDALIHPINALIKGLFAAYPNFQTSDIWIYDATGQAYPDWGPRNINTRFKAGCLYPGVRYFDSFCNEKAGYTSANPSANVVWRNPPGIATPPSGIKVTDVLVNATYVIDIPIVKRHWGTGVTLAFKNHFGSIENCYPLHDWVYTWERYYGGVFYNPLVDIYRNANIAGKTVLVIGDALFGNWENNYSKAKPWVTFGNRAPDSLLFATDPVAIDCVMCDFLDAELQLDDAADDYLVYANSVKLGTYERGNPWGSGYNLIDYVYLS